MLNPTVDHHDSHNHRHDSHNHRHDSHNHHHNATTPWFSRTSVDSTRPRRNSIYEPFNPESFIIAAVLIAIVVVIASALLDPGFVATAQGSLVGSTAIGAGLGASFGFGAASLITGGILYLATGAMFALYAGVQTSKSEKPWGEALKDVVYSNRYMDETVTIKGMFKAFGALLMSPFLLIGGLGGLGVRVGLNAYSDWKKTSLPIQDKSNYDNTSSSYTSLQSLLTRENTNTNTSTSISHVVPYSSNATGNVFLESSDPSLNSPLVVNDDDDDESLDDNTGLNEFSI